MTPEQEKKFEEWYTWAMNSSALVSLKPTAQLTWQACLDANGIGKEASPSFDDLCKLFESLAYSITKASDKLAEAIERGCEKAEKEKDQGKWIPKEGDAVFIFRGYDNDVSVARFVDIDAGGLWRVITANGQMQGIYYGLMKPFDASKIGKKWEEI